MRKRSVLTGVIVVGLALLLCSPWVDRGFATVEWEIIDTLKLESKPLDLALSPDGAKLYVLAKGEILVFSAADKKMQGKIEVDESVTAITLSPRGDILFASDSKNQTVSLIEISEIYSFAAGKSPFKGPANAPVTVVAFMEFQ
jgi:DNA-binding beta-propeller fold protein YncE